MPAASSAVRNSGVSRSIRRRRSRAAARRRGRIDSPRARLSPDVLGHDHEQQHQADEHQDEVAGQVRPSRGVVTADGQHAEERRERDHGQDVQARQEHERHDLEPVGRVPVGAHVAEDAQDVDGRGEADERAADHERDHDQARHVDAQVDGGARVGAQHVQAGAERGPREHHVDDEHDHERHDHADVDGGARAGPRASRPPG